jgi:hypothetical protein
MMVCIQKGTGLHEISNRRWGLVARGELDSEGEHGGCQESSGLLGVLLAGLKYWVWAVAVQTFYANRLDDMNHDTGLEPLSASR